MSKQKTSETGAEKMKMKLNQTALPIGASNRTVESSSDQSYGFGQQHAYAVGGYSALRRGFNSSGMVRDSIREVKGTSPERWLPSLR